VNYKFKDGKLFIEKNDYFKPELIFDCGQSFRFFNSENGKRLGIAFGSIIEIEATDKGYTVTATPEIEEDVLTGFFDLKRDYNEIEKCLSNDLVIKNAIEFGRGIRILKQEFFETLLTFIYSQRSNIPKIAKCVEKTAELFGEKIVKDGKTYYAFPTPDKMKNITVSDLTEIKCGYRCEYIVDAVNKVLSGEIDYLKLKDMPYQKAKETLMTIKGVGEKVADCVCLFSLGFFEAFPTDTWIKKAMESLYNIPEAEIRTVSADMFGNMSGIAQQYLFYYLRYNKA